MISIVGKPSFRAVYQDLRKIMTTAPRVENDRWQGIDVSKNPAAAMYELRGVDLEQRLLGEDLEYYRVDVAPNLPWADAHFAERVGGEPLNPGEEWRNWPWAASAERFRDGEQIFNHTYAERLWPKFARQTVGGKLHGASDEILEELHPIRGIAGRYGDLADLVSLLVKDPYTRQAWIPLFFPEDTGVGDGGRKPCTLGYQFIRRDDSLHVWYPLRSCDLVRHWRDDVYLAVRLLLWVLARCRERDSKNWDGVSPGTYGMHMTSLHVFENDRRQLIKENL